MNSLSRNGDGSLRVAVIAIMVEPSMRNKYPKGMSAVNVLTEIRENSPKAFPLMSVLDVANILTSMYGRPK